MNFVATLTVTINFEADNRRAAFETIESQAILDEKHKLVDSVECVMEDNKTWKDITSEYNDYLGEEC